jgi:hypothetical protein
MVVMAHEDDTTDSDKPVSILAMMNAGHQEVVVVAEPM